MRGPATTALLLALLALAPLLAAAQTVSGSVFAWATSSKPSWADFTSVRARAREMPRRAGARAGLRCAAVSALCPPRDREGTARAPRISLPLPLHRRSSTHAPPPATRPFFQQSGAVGNGLNREAFAYATDTATNVFYGRPGAPGARAARAASSPHFQNCQAGSIRVAQPRLAEQTPAYSPLCAVYGGGNTRDLPGVTTPVNEMMALDPSGNTLGFQGWSNLTSQIVATATLYGAVDDGTGTGTNVYGSLGSNPTTAKFPIMVRERGA